MFVISNGEKVAELNIIPLQAKQVMEVANLTERKNPHTLVKEFVCLSVCLSVCLTVCLLGIST